MNNRIAFIGGGNMASAIINGLLANKFEADNIHVVEPYDDARDKLRSVFGVNALASSSPALEQASLVIWAIKPQNFKDAALQARDHVANALHLSVAAGISSDCIAHWLGVERVVRAMPNTPALIGKGMSGLFARAAVCETDRQMIETVLKATGSFLWLDSEEQLDAVTAISGSGPAYVFYFIEGMIQAGITMGLKPQSARKFAIETFAGASALAAASQDPLETLQARVTSKGGTTYAALASMEHDGVQRHFIRAMHAARQRAAEMGREFGTD